MDSSFLPYAGMGGGLAGAGLGALLSNWQNPSNSANNYLSQIPGAMSPYYQPYINAGQSALGNLQGVYGNITNNPGGFLNQIGSNFQQSPGFNFALQQALKAANQRSNAGGMAGSPMNVQEDMQMATNLGNQDYYNWLDHATGLFNSGLQGQQGLATQGFNAANEMGQSMGNYLMQQANLNYQGQNSQNMHDQGMWGSLLGGLGDLGALAAFM